MKVYLNQYARQVRYMLHVHQLKIKLENKIETSLLKTEIPRILTIRRNALKC